MGQGEERWRTLLEAGLALSSELSLPAVLQKIVDLAAKVTGARYGALGVLGPDGRITDFFTTGISEEQRRAIGSLPTGRGILGLIVEEPRPLRLRNLRDHPRSFGFPPHHPVMTSFLGGPIRARGKVFGNLYLADKEGAEEFSEEDEEALVILATQAGVAIENARLYRETLEKARIEHELKIAAEIQRALLPAGRHDGAYYQASGTSLQARSIGGDFFDFIEQVDGTFGFLVGDVAGKGPAAALLTSKILGIFSAFTSVGDDPAQTVDHINKVLTRRAIDARYATLLYGQLDRAGQLTFCNGGHNPPLIYGRDGLRRLEAGGMPVGLFDAAPYTADRVTMQPGDTLVLYSDGVTEAHNVAGEEFGEARMVEVLQRAHHESAAAILDQLVGAVRTFAHGAEQYDDVTAVIVKYTG